MALVALVGDLRRAQDRCDATILSLPDLSVTSDAINHDILLDHLWRLGITGIVLQLTSFLWIWFQLVCVGGESSKILQCGASGLNSLISPFDIYMKLMKSFDPMDMYTNEMQL